MLDTLTNWDPDILGGTPVSTGTKVPVRILIDCLESGDPLDVFLENHPTVSPKQDAEVLERVNCGTRGSLEFVAFPLVDMAASLQIASGIFRMQG